MDGKDSKEGSLAAASAVAAVTPAGGLETLYRTYHRRVYRAAYRVTGNAADAEDVLGTVFLRLLRHGGTVEHPESYFHRAAVNVALDLIRSRSERGRVPLEDVESSLPAAAHLQPDEQLEAQELRACLRKGLVRLSPKAAELFTLRYFEGYSNPEIARLLGMSQITVSVSLHRSRRQLQRYLRTHFRAATGRPLGGERSRN